MEIRTRSSLADHLHNGGPLPAGIRRVDGRQPDEDGYTPVGQQQMESHVLVPLVWALVPAIIIAGLITGIAYRFWGVLDGIIPAGAFAIAFLALYFKRTARADRLLWKIEAALHEDIDGDGEIGEPRYGPRSIPVHQASNMTQLTMPPQSAGLTRAEWAQVATALLHHQGRVSRRGIYDNSDLSQGKASEAATMLLKKGYAIEGELTAVGWDWLLGHLPEHVTPRLERPSEGQNGAG